MMNNSQIKFVFFGGEPLGVPVLEELQVAGLLPALVVCSPDKPVGRKQVMTPPSVKVWAEKHAIEVWQPESWKGDEMQEEARAKLAPQGTSIAEIFVVVAYNHILPQWLLDIPEYGAVNLHPSLLPALRGASPIRSAILRDEPQHVGVTVMMLDGKMDHGPILDQMPMIISDENWPISGPELDAALARQGGALLAATIPDYLDGSIIPQEQPHDGATYCGKLQKADSELTIDPHNLPSGEDGRHAWRIINAFSGIGDTFFIHKGTRVKIKEAEFAGGKLRLLKVVPEGKSAVDFNTWLANSA